MSWRHGVQTGDLAIRVHGSYGPFRELIERKTSKIEARLSEVVQVVLDRSAEVRARRSAPK